MNTEKQLVVMPFHSFVATFEVLCSPVWPPLPEVSRLRTTMPVGCDYILSILNPFYQGPDKQTPDYGLKTNAPLTEAQPLIPNKHPYNFL